MVDNDEKVCEACGYPDWWVDNDCTVCGIDTDICEHGMSAWLCAHPIYHYPTDEMMMNGRYY